MSQAVVSVTSSLLNHLEAENMFFQSMLVQDHCVLWMGLSMSLQ